MPVENGVGVSEKTPIKEQDFGIFLRWHFIIVKSVWQRWNIPNGVYHYFDANAGPGYHESRDCPGSPMVFLATAKQMGIPYEAHFVEEDECIANALSKRVGKSPQAHTYCENNMQALPRLLRAIPLNRFGLIYFDPNGPPDFDLISKISGMPETQKLDLLVRCSATSVKRVRQYTGRRLTEQLARINKQIWIIKEIGQGDPHQWTFLLGTNYANQRDWAREGWLRGDSVAGAIQLERMDSTNAELEARRQPALFKVQ